MSIIVVFKKYVTTRLDIGDKYFISMSDVIFVPDFLPCDHTVPDYPNEGSPDENSRKCFSNALKG